MIYSRTLLRIYEKISSPNFFINKKLFGCLKLPA
jgi:hypothetical protein